MYNKVLLLTIAIASVHSASITDDLGIRSIYRVYEDCKRTDGIVPCLKKKAVLFFDRAGRMDSIPIVDGVNVVKSPDAEMPSVNESDIEARLPRNLKDKDQALTDMLWDKIASFANSRTIQLSLPKISGQELNKGVEEGRGKMKKMMGMMGMGMAMKMAALVPLALAALFVLAGKALIVSKVALLLAGIIALKKIIQQKNGGSGGESHGWSSGGGGGGGWDRRAYNDVSDLAYSAYKQKTN